MTSYMDERKSEGTAERFLARKREMLERYRTRLCEIRNPLGTSDEAWEQCALQAERIIHSCAIAVQTGSLDIPAAHISSVYDLATQRVTQGIHLSHSIRAGVTLFDVVLEVLLSEMGGTSALTGKVGLALQALQQGIGKRLEVGTIGYDALLLAKTREVHNSSYRRLARDVHDHIGAGLSLAMRQLELLEFTASPLPEAHAYRVAAAKDALSDTMLRIAGLITHLRAAADIGSLETSMKAYAASMALPGTTTSIQVTGMEEQVPHHVLDEVFMVLRECLRNAFVHADAAHVTADVDIAPNAITARVEDNGCGFDPEAVRASGRMNGLASVKERITLLGGKLVYMTSLDGGTKIKIQIPLQERLQQHV